MFLITAQSTPSYPSNLCCIILEAPTVAVKFQCFSHTGKDIVKYGHVFTLQCYYRRFFEDELGNSETTTYSANRPLSVGQHVT